MFPRPFLLAVLPVVLLLSSCTRAPNATQVHAQKQTTFASPQFPADDLGRPVNLKQPARRVVVIGPGAVETMFALGAQKQLVGRDDYANFPLQAKRVAIGGNFQGPNIEQCLALRADLVVVAQETGNKAKFEDWQSKLGVPVVALTATSFAALAKDFRKLGAWVGKPKEAATLAKDFEAPAILYRVAYPALIQTGDEAGWIAGRGTLVSEAAARAGYSNIANRLNIDGYKQINIESVVANQPRVLIVPSKKSKSQVLALLRADAGLSKLECVKKGRVIVVDGDLLLRPGPRLLQGVQQMRAAPRG